MYQIAELLSNNSSTPESGKIGPVKSKEDERNGETASTSSPSLCMNGYSPSRGT